MESQTRVCPGPVSRRTILELGTLGLAGLGLGDLLRLRAEANPRGSEPDTSVIFVWLPGGPPHTETFDLKPDAPLEYRGEMNPIATTVPGLQICEHLPQLAQTAQQYSIIRSISHGFADHGGGHKKFLTGRDPLQPTGFVNDYPMAGSMVAHMRQRRNVGVPNYVCVCDNGRTQVDTFSFGAAYLGPGMTPFTVGGDPGAAGFQVQNLAITSEMAARLDDRQRLLQGLDRFQRRVDQSGMMNAMDDFNQRAVRMLTSQAARQAFDLASENDATRDMYGRNAWGHRALLARRLVEAGASFVSVVLENPMPGQAFPTDVTYNWDSHAVNCHMFTDLRLKLPMLDQTIAALIRDIYQRGLDRRVLLVVTGEFGRTPRISYSNGRPGRDHWPSAMSLLVSGGGLRMGQVIGSTTSKAETPKDRPLEPNDLWATVFRHLGINPEHAVPDYSGRPMPLLPTGAPIRELI